jgi:hypothetical protein
MGLGVIASWVGAGHAVADPPAPKSIIQTTATSTPPKSIKPLIAINLDAVEPRARDSVAKIMRQPTIVARGGPEEFAEGIYRWLLDHPDRASLAWRRLGIPCAQIHCSAPDRFGWTDGQGTDVTWRPVLNTEDQRVWYAEGHARISPMTPAIPVRAVVVVSHATHPGRDGRRIVTQETDVYLQTDSKAAAIVARALGPTMPRLAEQGASQLLLFFSGLTRYFDRHPEDIGALLAAE